MKKLLATLFLSISLFSCSAGYVSDEPSYVETTRPLQPGVGYVWIDGNWIWNSHNRTYIHESGNWQRPYRNRTYQAGHWQHTNQGHRWNRGRWR